LAWRSRAARPCTASPWT